MAGGRGAEEERKRLGAWYTPQRLVEEIVDATIDEEFVRARHGRIRALDPACGDGRFLAAVSERVEALGGSVDLVGVDVDPAAISAAIGELGPAAELVTADALDPSVRDRIGTGFDLVIGNPPFLSQLAAATTRGGSSPLGGGAYADAAVEFLALATELVDGRGGRVAFVLPQSLLASRDAGPVRQRIDERAAMRWSTWTGSRDFDAQVLTCALMFEFGEPAGDPATGTVDDRVGGGSQPNGGRDPGNWAHVVTERLGVPPAPASLATDGSVLADRAWLNANFRDEYYGLVPAVGDHHAGPPLITSGLIDPGVSAWGNRPVRFAKQRFEAPRVDLDRLDDRMRRWAARRLVPKVLVANQTPILEAVADPAGEWLPGVPVVGVYPHDPDDVWRVAAALTAPTASVWAWHRCAGTGLAASTIRVGPVVLGELPWPSGDLDDAAAALRDGEVADAARLADAAFGVDDPDVRAWWSERWDRLRRRTSGAT